MDIPIISSYTRAQAIEDGLLIDVSKTSEAKECGIRFPIAFTRALWNAYVEVPEGVKGQDMKGRLWDILWLFRLRIKATQPGQSTFTFTVHIRNDNRRPKARQIKAVCGPGDQFEPARALRQAHLGQRGVMTQYSLSSFITENRPGMVIGST